MAFTALSPDFSIAPQLGLADVQVAASAGFRTLICTRPDDEEQGQPAAAEIRAAAEALGLGFVHIPVTPGLMLDADARQLRAVLDRMPGPFLGYCRSGARAARLRDMALVLPALSGTPRTYDVVIVGGGSAGIATASSLLKRNRQISIAVIDPAELHYYQPGWTMVGAGVFRPEFTRHTMASVMPRGVDWIRQAVTGFAPEDNEVFLADGSRIAYRTLVAAPGVKLDWGAIPGLAETLGKNGVTSNYRYDLAPYTRDLVGALKGGRALFTQPPMPIKCAGAPQKAMYLSCDRWARAGVLGQVGVEFHNAGAVLFGVADYVPALMDYVRRYGIDLNLESRLVGIDGPARVALFERKNAAGAVERVERRFDMLHAVPPQVAPDFVRNSPLADASGFIAVDPATLRHPVYANVFALGDACATSNAKTAAAARKQAPVVAVNVLAALDGRDPVVGYDGYGSCPLTVERGKIVLAEFGYGGKLLPSFPRWMLDGRKPTRRAWFLKDRMLPPIYWQGMLKGREWMAAPIPLDQLK